MPIKDELDCLVGRYTSAAPAQNRAKLVAELEAILLATEEAHVKSFEERRANGEIRYHDKELGRIVKQDELEFMHVVKEEYPCGCPKAGIVVRNWWNKWTPQHYMEPTWEFKYLSQKWMENLSGNYPAIARIGKSVQSLVSPFGPPCYEPNCIGSACIERKMRRASAPGVVGPYEGKPAYIIGSGPSLKKNHKELSRVTNGVRIAINGAVPLLDEFEIFLTMDWKGASWWSDGQREKLREAIGVLGWSAHPSVFDIEFKDMMIFSQAGKCSWDNWIREVFPWMVDLDRGFSSTYCAMNLAVLMGCHPIIFVGCDGCFGADMGMHAAYDDKPSGNEYDIIDHLDMHGKMVKTCMTYFLQNQCLKGASAWARLHGVGVFNASEDGILWMRVHDGENVIAQDSLAHLVDSNNLMGSILNETKGISSGSDVPVEVR